MAEKAGEGLQGCISCFTQETFRLRNVGVPRPSGFGDAGIGGHKSVFGNFSFYSYKKACGQKKTVRGSKNSRRLSNGTPAI